MLNYKFTGFADEAGTDIETQIRVTKALGWDYIESRNINGKNIHDISDEEFLHVKDCLEESGVKINCFGSEIANWSRDVRKQVDIDKNIEQLSRAITRMKQLNCQYLRGMSFTILLDQQPDTKEIRDLVIKNLSTLVKMCEDNGIMYLHENCMNFGGLSPDHTLFLLEQIDSPAFKLIFDTGNPVNSWDYREYPPTKKQDSWEFYQKVKKYIHYVHIKDCIFQKDTGALFPDTKHVWAGEGNGSVRRIVKDLLDNNYGGFFSIEPHMETVYHDIQQVENEDAKFSTYLEYGKRFMKMMEELS